MLSTKRVCQCGESLGSLLQARGGGGEGRKGTGVFQVQRGGCVRNRGSDTRAKPGGRLGLRPAQACCAAGEELGTHLPFPQAHTPSLRKGFGVDSMWREVLKVC